jgi:hypothetical protein
VQANAAPDDLVITFHGQFYYFYTGQEADYHIWFSKEKQRARLMPYMSKTRQISSYKQLVKLVKAQKGKAIWFALSISDRTEKVTGDLFRNYPVELRYQHAEDQNAKVFRLQT